VEAPTLFTRLLTSRCGALLLFLAASLVVYAPALQGGLLWDDEYLVGTNPFFRSPVFAAEVFRHWLFFESFSVYYRPVQNLSYMVDYLVWGGHPLGYHLTNILLHGLSGAVLFALLRRLLAEMRVENARGIALGVALVWTVHPIHNAAVAYVSGRADSLASLFAISAWLLTLQARAATTVAKAGALTVPAMLCGLAAFAAKEITLVWAALFLGYTVFLDPAPWRRKGTALGLLALVFLAYLGLRALPEARTPMAGPPAPPFTDRLLLMLRALGDYTWLIFFPDKLMMDRTVESPAAYASVRHWFGLIRGDYLSIIGLLALLGLLAGALRRHRGRGLCAAGAVWFGVGFLPVSNLFPLNAQVAEHWIYHASIGFLLFLAGLLGRVPARLGGALVALACVGLGLRTAHRAWEWAEPERFYRATIAAGGGTPRVHQNLASLYAQRGDSVRQEAILRGLLARFPDYAPARIALGMCLAQQGRKAEAEPLLDLGPPAEMEKVAGQFARTWKADLHLAALRAKEGQLEAALALLAEARARAPETWDLVKYDAQLRAQAGRAAEALPLVEAYAAARWWHRDAQLTLAELRLAAGDAAGALAAWQAAARLDVHDVEPWVRIAALEAWQARR
jgi:tetratricopeptide (TPR) repeat protein